MKRLTGLFLLLAIFCLLVPAQDRARRGPIAAAAGGGSVAYDDESSSGAVTSSPNTLAHTCSASANRVLLIWVVINSPARSVDTLTYSGVGAAFVDSAVSGQSKLELWRLIAPASGANNIVTTLNAGAPVTFGVIGKSYTGAHQTTPLGTPVFATATNSAPTVNVASAADEIVDDAATGVSGLARTWTVGAGQTQDINDSANNDVQLASSHETGAGTTTNSWSISGDVEWIIGAVAVEPA